MLHDALIVEAGKRGSVDGMIVPVAALSVPGTTAWQTASVLEDASVVIGRPGEATLALGTPTALADGSATSIPLRLSAGTVHATTTIEIEAWSGGVGSLIAFFDDLAAAWRGWHGSKDWDDDGPSIALRAVHDGIGLVSLSVSAVTYSGWEAPGSWEFRMTVPIEPGSLGTLAQQIRWLLEQPTAPGE